MSLNENNLVLRSFAQVMPIAETAAELFYGRLSGCSTRGLRARGNLRWRSRG